MDCYITDLGVFLPNDPVSNDEMEKILGMAGEVPSRTRQIILRNNQIRQRYYALDPVSGRSTHSNAKLTANAIRNLMPYDGFAVDDIECLCCGTGTPDQLLPGHGLMVHGELGSRPCEVISTSGICLSGLTALKYAYMNVALGMSKNAVATGSEAASSFLNARFFKSGPHKHHEELTKRPALLFNADFLRWMLSDGAAAAFLTRAPEAGKLALRIDWIEHVSFASHFETCMYAGCFKNADGDLRGWREFESIHEAVEEGAFNLQQDVKLLNREIVRTAVDLTLPAVIKKHSLKTGDVDWFLPHYSSHFFKGALHDAMMRIGFGIPMERWYSNLATKGNTGSAAIYIILEELFKSGRVCREDKLLCLIPESGRFSMCYMMMTAV